MKKERMMKHTRRQGSRRNKDHHDLNVHEPPGHTRRIHDQYLKASGLKTHCPNYAPAPATSP